MRLGVTNVAPPGGNSTDYADPEVTVWTGTEFDSLVKVADGLGSVLFPATAGTMYEIQVSDPGDETVVLPPEAFQLAGPGGCA